ncbi:UNVERIFIED_CONTAM: hypothetical protein HHA_273340 [Hammondia hammondi]|eukprot:XP_008882636.1 hypothetical protein HHA_273340 [Hammondia hammondi]
MDLVDLLERTRQQLLTKLSDMEARKNAVAVADNLFARILTRKEFVRIKGILDRGTQHATSIGSKLKRQVADIPKSKDYLCIKHQLRRSSSNLKEFLLSVKARAERVRSGEEHLRLKNKVEQGAINERQNAFKGRNASHRVSLPGEVLGGEGEFWLTGNQG